MKTVIIGAGPGGYETALYAAGKGADVTLVEEGRLGGTCLNEGCIPTKAFCRSAEMLEELKAASFLGVSGLEYGFDFRTAATRKNEIVDRLRDGIASLMQHPRINLVYGRASFSDARTVMVQHADGSSSVISGADSIIIATGSVPAWLDIPGAHLPGVISSGQLLDYGHVPERLCIIGGGVIGLEFASIFRSFGSEVSVVEYCREILPRYDSDIAKRLRQSLSKRGIGFCTGAQVSEIVRSADGASLSVVYVRKGMEERTEADTVLMAVGRRPAVSSLNLDAAGVEYDARGIMTDADMQTNVPGIYAVGDITGGVMLAHAASMQGIRAVDHMMGIEDNIDLSVMPAAVFTMPEVASVGRTEDECKASGEPYSCRKSFFRANGKAMCLGETEGLCKIITDGMDRIVGCHIIGPHASDLIHEMTAFISMGASIQALHDMVHVHPSLNEIFR